MEEEKAIKSSSDERNCGKPSWHIRRRIVASTLIYCAVMVGYITIYGGDTELNRTIANALIFLSGSTISSYVFGAVWEDKSKQRV
jgi:hypothetical protein